MRGRFGLLRTLLAGLALVVCLPKSAWAHRLVVECRILPDHKVQVEGWYNSPTNPHPAVRAKVDVLRSDGSRLIEGELDASGFFTFSYERPEDLNVVVYQTGHREEVLLSALKLGLDAPAASQVEKGNISSSPIKSEHESLREWVREVLIGVGFVLALAAFVLSVRNARELRRRKETQD
jgi:hypothetical protein